MTTIKEFSLEATKRYLQNVVFIDDEIYDLPTGRPVNVQIQLQPFKAPFANSAKAKEVENDIGYEQEKIPYHPKHLVQSFAKEGMVCALYEPTKGFGTEKESEIFKLCERADVVILDWDLFGEDGNNILPLIKNLVDDSQNSIPHHVRLCAIYTTKPDLGRVAGAIYEFLSNAKLTVDPVNEALTLLAGATRIIVLGKPNVPGRSDEHKKAEVEELNLAPRIIAEFSQMNSGVFPSYALYGISSIRRNSKKILDKFHAEMDGPFLLHRALTISSEDAFDQLPELLAEEVLAVISDEQITSDQMNMLAHEVAGSLPMKTNNLTLESLKLRHIDGKPEFSINDLVRKYLGAGFPAIELGYKQDKDKDTSSLVKQLHIAMGCNETKSEKSLASLFGVRTKYFRTKAPALGFGTIVRYREPDTQDSYNYAFCLMPICDSVRLSHGDNQRVSFPFWKLAAVKKNENGRGVVFQTKEGEFVELMAAGKPRNNLWMESFEAGASGMVIGNLEHGSFCFAGEKLTLEWVVQLKPAHAQRIAHDIGQSFSRVGVVEAEWLRLLTG